VQIKIRNLERSRGTPLRCQKCVQETGWYEYTKRCRGESCRLRQREYYSSRRYVVWDWCRGIPIGPRPTYTRGFVSGIASQTSDFMFHAATVFAGHPIANVTLTDREPHLTNGRYFFQSGRGAANPYSTIPDALCPFWPREWSGASHHRAVVYSDPNEAVRDLSAACVAYGRERAGLSREPLAA
jgi:hypothetical protein